MNTGILYVKMFLTVFISLYVTRLVLNALGSEDFGVFNVVGGIIGMLSFLNGAMTTSTQRFMSHSAGKNDLTLQKQIFNNSIILHFIIGIAAVILFEVAGPLFFKYLLKLPESSVHAAKMIYQFMIVSTFFTIISVPYDAVINARENMLLYAILGIIETLLKLVIAVAVVYTASDKLILYGLLMASLSVVMLIVRQIYCHRKYPECHFNPKEYYHRGSIREQGGFASWSLLGSATSMISWYGVGVLLNNFFGTIVNAAQGVAGQINGQISAFANTMSKALNPQLMKSEGACDRERMHRLAFLGSKAALILFSVFAIPLFIEATYIMKIWLKNVPEYAIIFLKLVLIRTAIEQTGYSFFSCIQAVGKIKKYQIATSIVFTITLPLSYMLFRLGCPPYAIYIVLILSAIAINTIIIYMANRYAEISLTDYLKNIVARMSATILIVAICGSLPLLFMNEGIIRLILVCVICSASYLFALYFVSLSEYEKHIAMSKIDSLKFKINSIFVQAKRYNRNY